MGDLPIPKYDPATLVRSESFMIDAPAKLVWEILLDMPHYGAWNPFCVQAESTLDLGAPVHMPVIEIDGDTATGLWTLRDYALNLAEDNKVTEGAAHYRDHYVRRDGRWMIARTEYDRVYERVYQDEYPSLTAHLLAELHAARRK